MCSQPSTTVSIFRMESEKLQDHGLRLFTSLKTTKVPAYFSWYLTSSLCNFATKPIMSHLQMSCLNVDSFLIFVSFFHPGSWSKTWHAPLFVSQTIDILGFEICFLIYSCLIDFLQRASPTSRTPPKFHDVLCWHSADGVYRCSQSMEKGDKSVDCSMGLSLIEL